MIFNLYSFNKGKVSILIGRKSKMAVQNAALWLFENGRLVTFDLLLSSSAFQKLPIYYSLDIRRNWTKDTKMKTEIGQWQYHYIMFY